MIVGRVPVLDFADKILIGIFQRSRRRRRSAVSIAAPISRISPNQFTFGRSRLGRARLFDHVVRRIHFCRLGHYNGLIVSQVLVLVDRRIQQPLAMIIIIETFTRYNYD